VSVQRGSYTWNLLGHEEIKYRKSKSPLCRRKRDKGGAPALFDVERKIDLQTLTLPETKLPAGGSS
jgi:hypothetical protein